MLACRIVTRSLTWAALACGLFAFGTVDAVAETLYKNSSSVCRTVYKDARGRACPGIAGAGQAVGCITAGTPTTTNNNGQSAVTVTWASTGTGSYEWQSVGGCDPSPLRCNYKCVSKEATLASDEELGHAESIAAWEESLRNVFAADTVDSVAGAVDRAVIAAQDVPQGSFFGGEVLEAVIAELYDLYGLASVLGGDLDLALQAGGLMDSDFALAWPDSDADADVADQEPNGEETAEETAP